MIFMLAFYMSYNDRPQNCSSGLQQKILVVKKSQDTFDSRTQMGCCQNTRIESNQKRLRNSVENFLSLNITKLEKEANYNRRLPTRQRLKFYWENHVLGST